VSGGQDPAAGNRSTARARSRDRTADSRLPRASLVTNPDKVLWPESGLTKGDLIAYYQAVAPVLLPHLRGRPLVLKLYPNGITGRSYYRQTLPKTAPAWLPRWQHAPRGDAIPNQMLLVDDLASLTWLANQAAIEIHPWLSRIDAPEQPDYVVFDLDVLDAALFPRALQVALLVRGALEAQGLAAYPKTTGGDGIHIYVPIRRGPGFAQTRAWALALAQSLCTSEPDWIAIKSRKAGRETRVLIDYAQNALGRTTVAPYSVRPRPGAPVSMPLTWEEVAAGGFRPDDFTMRTAPARLAERGDLFAPVLHGTATLPP
jgi:bifunctional non-homologous end joining protein LigD